MADDEVQLRAEDGSNAELDQEFENIIRAQQVGKYMSPASASSAGEGWDEPFDLRVLRPRAVDLRKLWRMTGQSEPTGIAATMGSRRPVLINHVLTPFPVDGRTPGRVWGLGYEFVPHDIDANTVSVIPDDDVMEIGKVGQFVDLGLELGGKVGLPAVALSQSAGPTVSLTGASLRVATAQQFQFALQMRITLRKVIGAGVGTGGAQWKLYRQNEPIDQPHTLLQTLLVPETVNSIRCTIKTWAKQAGLFGTSWGARFWKYPEQQFEINLSNL